MYKRTLFIYVATSYVTFVVRIVLCIELSDFVNVNMLTVLRKVKFRPAISHRKCNFNSNNDKNNDKDEPETRMIYGNEYRPWRKPWLERPGEVPSKFALFSISNTSNVTFKRILNYPEPLKWMQDLEDFKIKVDQEYVAERCSALGPDLALAHFIVFRGGKIKFKNHDTWITKYEEEDGKELLPKSYISDIIVEMVDCENFQDGLRYDGLDNFYDLIGLKYLSFKGNIYFDDWCLDKISHIVRSTLECIDLRGTKITHRGIVALTKVNYLNLIILGEDQYDENMELTCALFEHDKPDLLVKIVPKDT